MDGRGRCRHAQGRARGGRAGPARRAARQLAVLPERRARLPQRCWQWAQRARTKPPSRSRARAATAPASPASCWPRGARSSSASGRRRRDAGAGKSDLIDATLAARRLLGGEGLSQPARRRPTRGAAPAPARAPRVRAARAPRRSTSCTRSSWRHPTLRESARRARSSDRSRGVLAPAQPRGTERVLAAVLRRLGAARLACSTDELARTRRRARRRSSPSSCPSCSTNAASASSAPRSCSSPAATRSACSSEAAFAALAGTSPVDASSGRQQRHRLNRGGDRQLNRALHVIALARIRHHPETACLLPNAHSRPAKPPAKPAAASNAPSPATSTTDSRLAQPEP